MLRITYLSSCAASDVVKVEGRIAGDYVVELSRVASAALEKAPAVLLDLADVTYVDHNGALLLRALQRRGAELVQCSSLVRSLVNGGVE